MAQREVGLSAGEPPATRGYPPSVFTLMPRLLERAGAAERGSITGLYTVLVEGDDMNEPIADAARSLLDGHIVLSRRLATANHFPSIEVLESISRVEPAILTRDQRDMVSEIRRLLAAYREAKDLIEIGAYVTGSNPLVDRAVRQKDRIDTFLRQDITETVTLERVVGGAVGRASPRTTLPRRCRHETLPVRVGDGTAGSSDPGGGGRIRARPRQSRPATRRARPPGGVGPLRVAPTRCTDNRIWIRSGAIATRPSGSPAPSSRPGRPSRSLRTRWRRDTACGRLPAQRVAALEHLDERRRAEWLVEEQRAEMAAIDESAIAGWLADVADGHAAHRDDAGALT